MSEPAIVARLRDAVLAQPDVILDDRDMMRALVNANDRALGDNIVDMRGLAMERLEARIDRLEDTHQTVLAAAFENLSGMGQVHRAVLRMLAADDFATFLGDLGGPVANVLRVDRLRLVLESNQPLQDPALVPHRDVLLTAGPGFVADYLALSKATHREIVLRTVPVGIDAVHGSGADDIRSEALMPLDLGPGRLAALLVLGAVDPHQFTPGHATDLLDFFARVLERTLRRWLA